MLSRLESQSLLSTSVPHPSEGHCRGCLSATSFRVSDSEVLLWEGDAWCLCTLLGAGAMPPPPEWLWGGGLGREAIKKISLRAVKQSPECLQRARAEGGLRISSPQGGHTGCWGTVKNRGVTQQGWQGTLIPP